MKFNLIGCKHYDASKVLPISDKVDIDNTLILNFEITWKLSNNQITSLPRKERKIAKDKCLNKKVTLISLTTEADLTAKGIFRCVE